METRRWVCLALLSVLPRVATAQDLMDLLQRGPVVLVETNAKGKFDKATAVNVVKKPPAEVWKLATDFAHYKDFMPKIVRSEPVPIGPNKVDVKYEIDTPLTNTKYTFRYDIEPDTMKMHAKWVKGDIKDSFAEWKLVPYGEDTLVYYTCASRNFSSIAASLEDDQQTITVGVNVSAALAVVKAIKRQAENPTPPQKP
jgi:ribosome-associated toxin RatA of RatAB toxin-antitoxin module